MPPGKPSGYLTKGKFEQTRTREECHGKMRARLPQAWEPPEAGGEAGTHPSEAPSQGARPCQHLGFGQVTPISGFWPPETLDLCDVFVQSLSHVPPVATPQTAAHQAPQSMGFPRQEYWSGLIFPSPGDLPDSRSKP